MANSLRIAVDAMGGDIGPRAVVAALLTSLRKHSGASALIFGDRQKVVQELNACTDPTVLNRIHIRHCEVAIDDQDRPSAVLRHKQDSSMGLALKAVADGEAHACISAGNTGALMALGLVRLKTLPGISRPAICATFPTSTGRSFMLDLGANVDCSPRQLHQFAVLGSLTAQAIDNISAPIVRLLNVGEEESKGGDDIAQTSALLESDPMLNYQGYVEGDGVFKGTTDVVVCDGFAGNVAVKTSEGLAIMIKDMFKTLHTSSWTARLGAFLMRRKLIGLQARLDPAFHNGAYLLGLNGVVIKSHGGASEKAFGHALEVALQAAKHNLPSVLLPILKDKMDNKVNRGL
ncbi:MAG: phosphate acyltransferase PlsX [Porticoccaceae bacterium]|nr:phosphate acyltransferase PlsX [Porticoccaceae bacterium]